MPDATQPAFRAARDAWLDRRFPDSEEITLSQKKIFVLPTATSLAFVFTTVLLFVMAANFQNALIFALCFWLLSLLIINIFFTYRNLSGLTIRAAHAENCFAGEKAVFEVEISCPPHHAAQQITLGWKDEDAAELNLLAGQSKRIKLSHNTEKRGKLKPSRISILTRFPTGLIVAWSYASLNLESIIYPKPVAQETVKWGANSDDMADVGKEIACGASDFAGIRDYEPGDSLKHIHWGIYAKTGQLHSKSFVDYASEDLWLDWDKLGIPGVESKLSHLCAQVLHCHQQQLTYGLKLPGKTLAPALGESHRNACLIALALFGEDSQGC